MTVRVSGDLYVGFGLYRQHKAHLAKAALPNQIDNVVVFHEHPRQCQVVQANKVSSKVLSEK